MKLIYYSLSALAILVGGQRLNAQITHTFNYTGAMQSFTVPACVTQVTVFAQGAQGDAGGMTGGLGASVRGVLSVSANQVLNIYVGGQGSGIAGGFNGGGAGGVSSASSGGGGGGATDIRLNGVALSDRIIVAGGGGGGGGTNSFGATGGDGGAGSAFTSAAGYGGGAGISTCGTSNNGGETGGTAPNYGTGGGGGGYTSGGGGGGAPSSTTGGYGCAGTLGGGGAGGGTSFICGGATGGINGGGGGGGGYYGGGGGMTGTGGCNGGGGGGSTYANSTLFSNLTYTAGNRTANGYLTLAYSFNGSTVSIVPSNPMNCNGSNITLTGGGSVTYTWSTNQQGSSISVNPTSNTSYTVYGTNNLGCVSQAVVTVTVSSALPVLTVNSSTNSVCLGRTVTLTATGALSYTWTNGVTNGVSFVPSTTNTYTVSGQNGCGITTSLTTVTVSPLPVSIASSTTTVCSTKPATLTASAAATGFTWTPGPITNSMAIVAPASQTVYTVTVSDGICNGVGTVTINTKPNPTLTVVGTGTDVCTGATVGIVVSGADSYTWTPSTLTGSNVVATPNAPTAYQVSGSNSVGCVSNDQYIVVTKNSPTLTTSSNPAIICPAANSTLAVSGASTYVWDNSTGGATRVVNPALTTVYSVTGTAANGCKGTGTVQVAVVQPTLSISAPSTVCPGSAVTLTAGTGSNYQWSTGGIFSSISPTPSGLTTYTVGAQVTNSNVVCTATNQVSVNLFAKPNVTAGSTRTVICRNEKQVITASGAQDYFWTHNNTAAQSATISSPITQTVTYSVIGTDVNGCKDTAYIEIRISGCTGIEEVDNGPAVRIYPNPASGNVTIQGESAMQIEIFSQSGQLIRKAEVSPENNFSIKITGLDPGLYFISGRGSEGSFSQKLIVR